MPTDTHQALELEGPFNGVGSRTWWLFFWAFSFSMQSSELCEGVAGERGSLLSHSAVSQGIIITRNDSLIKRADSRLHILMHF